MRASSLLLCGVLALSASACKSTSGSGAAKEDLALVPKESGIILMANVARMRNTAMWRKLLDVRDSDPQSKKDFEEFTTKGYEAATVAGIAKRAGVTTGAVYAHFAGKLDLLLLSTPPTRRP